MNSQRKKHNQSAIEVVSTYAAAMDTKDTDKMQSYHAEDFMVDWVFGDAYENPPSSAEESNTFSLAWFAGFGEVDYEIKRTIAVDEVVVTEWVFTGTHTGPLGPPVFEERLEPTGRTIQLRGVTIYDVNDGLIQRETIYMDLATLIVELGVDV